MDVAVMQAVRLKGMVTAEAAGAATGRSEGEAAEALAALVAEEHVQERNGRFRVTREGRDRLDALLAEERQGVDQAALKPLYEEFDPFNSEFKDMAHRWQMRDGEPNDHTDKDYDGEVLAGLDGLHERFSPLVAKIVAIAPDRMNTYPARFEGALKKVRAGDSDWFLKPLMDSYHTVWFELHEEIIGLLGLSRQQEATEGRA